MIMTEHFSKRVKRRLRHLKAKALKESTLDMKTAWVSEPPAEPQGKLERFFWDNDGRAIDKWLHYFPIYERHLEPFRDRPVRVLEIGVQNGGSAQMWRHWFGQDAVIFGIDIDPACAEADGEAAQIRIGSQNDPKFLTGVVDEMGGVDVVIDDGSHVMSHIHASFEALFPLLSEGGIYLVEDLHTAYWRKFGGGFRSSENFIETAKRMIDDMHFWYHGRSKPNRTSANLVGGLHFYDSIVVIDKEVMTSPRRSVTGKERTPETQKRSELS